MIITCPACGRKFELQRTPPKTFKCPKCSFSTPFNLVIGQSMSSQSDMSNSMQRGNNVSHNPGAPTAGTNVVDTTEGTNPGVDDGKTRVVDGLGTHGAFGAQGEKTALVPGLQKQTKRGVFQLTYAGVNYGVIPIPVGKTFNVGRRSSDGNAVLKLTPDISMSREHAMMRTTQGAGGVANYQIATLKSENPVYVNGAALPKGKGYSLKPGDKIKMGETDILFRLI